MCLGARPARVVCGGQGRGGAGSERGGEAMADCVPRSGAAAEEPAAAASPPPRMVSSREAARPLPSTYCTQLLLGEGILYTAHKTPTVHMVSVRRIHQGLSPKAEIAQDLVLSWFG